MEDDAQVEFAFAAEEIRDALGPKMIQIGGRNFLSQHRDGMHCRLAFRDDRSDRCLRAGQVGALANEIALRDQPRPGGCLGACRLRRLVII